MHRFYLPPDTTRSSTLRLTDSEARHAAKVLRLKQSDRLTVLDGRGQELLCEVAQIESRTVALQVVQRHLVRRLPYEITLVQAIPKGKAMDDIVEKATELGASRIVPLLSERSEVHLKNEDAYRRRKKWENTAIEAMKQCGNAWLPCVEAPISTGDFLVRGDRFDLSLIASLQGDHLHPRQVFKGFLDDHNSVPKTLAVWVGPEGDFAPTEINAIKSAGSVPVTLGPLTLRSETAAIYLLSILSYELQAGIN